MSSKRSKKEKATEVVESSSEEEIVQKKKTSKKEKVDVDVSEDSSQESSEDSSVESEEIVTKKTKEVQSKSDESEEDEKQESEDDSSSEPEVESKSKKSTKASKEKPKQESDEGEASAADSDEEEVIFTPRTANRPDIERIFFKVVECKGVSSKPKNYFVTVSINDKKAYKSSTTKKNVIWEDSGRLLPIAEDVTSLKVTLYEKGILKSAKGFTTLQVEQLVRGYPYNRWYPLTTKKGEKGALHLQVMLVPPNENLGSEFTLPLHTLLKKDKFELFHDAVDEAFTDLQAIDNEGKTALHLASEMGMDKYVKILLKKIGKSAPTLKTNKGNTALHSACLSPKCNTEVLDLLLKAKFDPTALNNEKETPLHLAALANNAKAIEVLVAKGAKVNSTDKDKNLPLSIALLNHAPEAVRALVKLNTNIYKKNAKDMTVWEIAQRKDMVNTEPRKAFMEELNVHDPREFEYRREFNKKVVSEGKKISVDFLESAQFALSVKKETEVVVLITSPDVLSSIDFAEKSAFVLSKSNQGVHNEPDFSRDAIAFGGQKCLKITLEPDYFYTVLPYVKNSSLEGKYTLIVLTREEDKCDVKELKQWKYSETVEGRWKKKTAGGAQQNSTWLNNPQYELTLPQEDDVRFLVYLAQEPDDPSLRLPDGGDLRKMPFDYNIGFFLMDRGAAKVIDQTEKFVNSRGTHKEFVIDCSKHNHLTVVPSTWNPGEESVFTLKVYCDSPISLIKK